MSVEISWLLKDVSIHAPVKGATNMEIASGRRYIRFNPRARKGRDEA